MSVLAHAAVSVGLLLLCAAAGRGVAADAAPAAPALEDAAPAEGSALSQSATSGSIVIEAEPIVEPGLDVLMRRFGEALDQDRRPLDLVERPLPGGAFEVITRYGRLCIAPLPIYLGSDLTAGGTLASFCEGY